MLIADKLLTQTNKQTNNQQQGKIQDELMGMSREIGSDCDKLSNEIQAGNIDLENMVLSMDELHARYFIFFYFNSVFSFKRAF